MTYTHRNGETEPPTDDGGFYWFRDSRLGGGFGLFIVMDGRLLNYGPDGETLIANLHGRWWGPVTPPWVDDASGEA